MAGKKERETKKLSKLFLLRVVEARRQKKIKKASH